MAVKNSLEIIIKQVHLEGGFKRGGRIRVAECLRQIVPNRWASSRKRSFTKCLSFFLSKLTVFTGSIAVPLAVVKTNTVIPFVELKKKIRIVDFIDFTCVVDQAFRPPLVNHNALLTTRQPGDKHSNVRLVRMRFARVTYVHIYRV